jgi:hypothetical protein
MQRRGALVKTCVPHCLRLNGVLQRPKSLGESSRSWLQDQRRFDFSKSAALDRGQLSEPWSGGHFLRSELLAAPWVSELIEAAGGVDIFDDRASGKSAKDRIVTMEEIVAREPEVIIGSCSAGGA